MEVITISSDSEASMNEADITIKNTSLPSTEWYENCTIDWNDDVNARPAINYNQESPKEEVLQKLHSDIEIKDFITPMKINEKNASTDLIAFDDENSNTCVSPAKSRELSPTSDLETFSQSSNYKFSKAKPRQKFSQEEKEKEKIVKEQKKLEKEKQKEEKKAELQKLKALKAAFVENKRNLKPEENIKFFKVHIDNDIINCDFGRNIISVLQEHNIQYVVESQTQKYTVRWSKKRVEKIIDDFGKITENIVMHEENVLLYTMDWFKAVELVSRNELLNHVEMIRSAYFDKKLTVVIFGIKKYFNHLKNKRNNDMRALINEKKKSKFKPAGRLFEEAPFITKDQLEFAITDLQILGHHNCRFIETPEEFSSLIHNITKSLSQIDFKLEKQKRQNQDFAWIPVDSHQSVKVDKNGNGLLHLWQQQISQFNAVGIETAQAVVSQHRSPLALMNLYEQARSTKEGELLLQNIQIRREAGILSTSRRVGPQLSKKIYNFFTTDEPDLEL